MYVWPIVYHWCSFIVILQWTYYRNTFVLMRGYSKPVIKTNICQWYCFIILKVKIDCCQYTIDSFNMTYEVPKILTLIFNPVEIKLLGKDNHQ